MVSGPQTYAKLSSVAKEFLKNRNDIVKPKLIEKYEYLGEGANLSNAVKEPDTIHKFLSQTAITENVDKEFGKAIDILG